MCDAAFAEAYDILDDSTKPETRVTLVVGRFPVQQVELRQICENRWSLSETLEFIA